MSDDPNDDNSPVSITPDKILELVSLTRKAAWNAALEDAAKLAEMNCENLPAAIRALKEPIDV